MFSGVDGDVGGELRGGRWSSEKVRFRPRRVPIKIEKGDGLTRGRGGSWWRKWRGGGPGDAGMAWLVTVAGVAGEEGDDPLPSIDG